MNLPIDVISGTNPPRFKWTQTFDSTNGTGRVQQCEGVLPPSVEQAVAKLIALTKQQAINIGVDATVLTIGTERIAALEKEVEKLRKQVEGHVERIAAQSELLSKKAEAQGKRGRVT